MASPGMLLCSNMDWTGARLADLRPLLLECAGKILIETFHRMACTSHHTAVTSHIPFALAPSSVLLHSKTMLVCTALCTAARCVAKGPCHEWHFPHITCSRPVNESGPAWCDPGFVRWLRRSFRPRATWLRPSSSPGMSTRMTF